MPVIFKASQEPKAVTGPVSQKIQAIEQAIDDTVGKPTKNLLSPFVVKPKKVRFETQEQKEEIILLLRRHPITNLRWIFQSLLMILVPLFVHIIVPFEIPANFRLIGGLSWYLFTFAVTFEKFLSWLFNVNIITDERIVDIDFPSILFKDVSEVKIDKVQEVNTVTGGFFQTLFNYGDVLIQAAGEQPRVCFESVPNPGKVSVVLNQLMLQEEQEKIEGRVR